MGGSGSIAHVATIMSFLDWLKSRFTTRSGGQKVRLSIDDSGVTCHRSSGMVETIRWDDLKKVTIRTSDAGPFAVDAFYVLHGSKGGCVVPQSAAQSGELLERLQQLPDFDNNAVVSAMGSTESNEFLCWERPLR